jgi:hypothetical protein
MQAMRSLKGVGVKTTFAILLAIVVPAVITLRRVQVPTTPLNFSLASAPYGYTVSLIIYLIPVLAIYFWFRRRYREGQVADDRRSAYRWTLWTLIPLGFILDIAFGYAFFTFPNPSAILPIPLVPAFASDQPGFFVRYLPIEEFAFYALGFTAILSAYIWGDEYWLKAYNVPDYGEKGAKAPLVQLELTVPLVISALLIGGGYIYKRYGSHDAQDGFPSYFTFLVIASLLPSLLFFRSTRAFVNWRAVSFAALWVVLTSLIWEATLAIPYGWWGYKEWHMLGLSIDAWSGLPFEASLLWLSVTFTTVTVYEMFKIRSAAKRLYNKGWWETFFGSARTTQTLA